MSESAIFIRILREYLESNPGIIISEDDYALWVLYKIGQPVYVFNIRPIPLVHIREELNLPTRIPDGYFHKPWGQDTFLNILNDTVRYDPVVFDWLGFDQP
jgi:hypothetical protein